MASARDRRRRTGGRDAQAGQGLVEYALIFVLVVIVAVVSLAFFGTAVSDHLSSIGTSV
jgi:Flp pilus assembly pilin Flp